jgi:hypothetical protein
MPRLRIPLSALTGVTLSGPTFVWNSSDALASNTVRERTFMTERKTLAQSLSILVTVRPLRLSCALLAIAFAGLAARQETPETKPPETFFAGTVDVCTPQKIVVSRAVLGKTEKREFKLTADTKVEGKLRTRVRVTVRYESAEGGDTATLVVVRQPDSKNE